MNLSEILKSKGVEAETIDSILSEMKANKIYLSNEDNIDIRYSKLKTDHDGKLKELEEATNVINELKKSQEGNQSVLDQIKTYEEKVKELEAENESIKLDSQLKLELLENGVQDIDYMMFKIKNESDADIKLDDKGKIKGFDGIVDDLKIKYPTQFKAQEQTKDEKIDPKELIDKSQLEKRMTKDEIMAITDTRKRQDAIKENLDLFE